MMGALALTASLALFGASRGEAAGLTLAEATALAREHAPSLRAVDAAIAGADVARGAADALPAPRLAGGIENLPAAGPDRLSTTRDPGTMQRLALMQDVPNRAKREARVAVADARAGRERAGRDVAALAVRRDVSLAWMATWYAERRLLLLADARRENDLLQQTLPARIASGQAMAAELTMARQEALVLDDRADDLARDIRRARADLRRLVGARGDDALEGEPPLGALDPEAVRAALHRHAELAPVDAMRALTRAEMAEAASERRGDWSWEVAYSRRPRYDDMVSFQLTFELPWQRERRVDPLVTAKRRELERIDAEREDLLRRHAAEIEAMLAEERALAAQAQRLEGRGRALAGERVALALAAYQAGRGELAAVLAARTQAVELSLRALELAAQRQALRVRLSTYVAEE